ncbi:MAG TPA: hypothetical protein VFD83_05240, partial [Candidatus Polarisedimenticolia bacterium]|nr:hypothetical protein [Candidatus Polarisedimenticolia bacterium]
YQSVTFSREDFQFKTALASARPVAGETPPITEADVTDLLGHGAQASDGSYTAIASLFLPGKPAGPLSLRGRRHDDPNDWYRHQNRRELRGLYVLYSWVNNWDVKDHQTLDMYGKSETKSHLTHNLLDVDASLGAAAQGPKRLDAGFENRVDFHWAAKRLVTLGFVREPWRRAKQETGIPSVGNFQSKVFDPGNFRASQEVPPFREMTDRDGYWGAKLVASFSNAQIEAAVDAAHYEDPRAAQFLLPALIERRERIERYWFDRVAPLDYFTVAHGILSFHDLALDLGLTERRQYDVELDAKPTTDRVPKRARITSTSLTLPDTPATTLSLTLRVAGSHAAPARVELQRQGSEWIVTRVRHA